MNLLIAIHSNLMIQLVIWGSTSAWSAQQWRGRLKAGHRAHPPFLLQCHWMGFRQNLQETKGFPMKCEAMLRELFQHCDTMTLTYKKVKESLTIRFSTYDTAKFPTIVPQNRWFKMEHPIKLSKCSKIDNFGASLGNLHIWVPLPPSFRFQHRRRGVMKLSALGTSTQRSYSGSGSSDR